MNTEFWETGFKMRTATTGEDFRGYPETQVVYVENLEARLKHFSLSWNETAHLKPKKHKNKNAFSRED